MTNDDLFVHSVRAPYCEVYRLNDFGLVEVYPSGRIIAVRLKGHIWHGYCTIQEAKDWLLSEAMKIRMMK